MPRLFKPVSRLHSKDPADTAWRARQAQVDADIEGLSRDPQADRLAAEMAAAGVAPRQRIETDPEPIAGVPLHNSAA